MRKTTDELAPGDVVRVPGTASLTRTVQDVTLSRLADDLRTVHWVERDGRWSGGNLAYERKGWELV